MKGTKIPNLFINEKVVDSASICSNKSIENISKTITTKKIVLRKIYHNKVFSMYKMFSVKFWLQLKYINPF